MQAQTATSELVPASNVANIKTRSGDLMNIIEMVATEPTADIEKMERLYSMHTDALNRESDIEYNRAMAACQAELEPIARDADNKQTSSKYSRLETIIQAIKPVYSKHGFSVSFSTADCPTEGWIRTQAKVRHIGGHTEIAYLDMPPDDKGIAGKTNKTVHHGIGSSLTYCRRYLLLLIFNLAMSGEDVDGNAPQQDQQPAGERYINDQQLANLRKQMKAAGIDDNAFCRKAQIERVNLLPQARLRGSLKWLESVQNKTKENAK